VDGSPERPFEDSGAMNIWQSICNWIRVTEIPEWGQQELVFLNEKSKKAVGKAFREGALLPSEVTDAVRQIAAEESARFEAGVKRREGQRQRQLSSAAGGFTVASLARGHFAGNSVHVAMELASDGYVPGALRTAGAVQCREAMQSADYLPNLGVVCVDSPP